MAKGDYTGHSKEKQFFPQTPEQAAYTQKQLEKKAAREARRKRLRAGLNPFKPPFARTKKLAATVAIGAGAVAAAPKVYDWAIDELTDQLYHLFPEFVDIGRNAKRAKNIVGGTRADDLGNDTQNLAAHAANEVAQVTFKINPEVGKHIEHLIALAREVEQDYSSFEHGRNQAGFFIYKGVLATGDLFGTTLDSLGKKLADLIDVRKQYDAAKKAVEGFVTRRAIVAAKNNAERYAPNRVPELERVLESWDKRGELETLDEALQKQVKEQQEQLANGFGQYQDVTEQILRTYDFQTDTAAGLDDVIKTMGAKLKQYNESTTLEGRKQALVELHEYMQEHNAEVNEAIEARIKEAKENGAQKEKALNDIVNRIDKLKQTAERMDEAYAQDFRDQYFELKKIRDEYGKFSGKTPEETVKKLDVLKGEIDRIDGMIETKYAEMRRDEDIVSVVGKSERPSEPYDAARGVAQTIILGSAAIVGAAIVGTYVYRQLGKLSPVTYIVQKMRHK